NSLRQAGRAWPEDRGRWRRAAALLRPLYGRRTTAPRRALTPAADSTFALLAGLSFQHANCFGAAVGESSEGEVADCQPAECEGRPFALALPSSHISRYQARQVARNELRLDHRLAHRGFLREVINHDPIEKLHSLWHPR